MPKLEYSEVIEIRGIRIPLAQTHIDTDTSEQIRAGTYQTGECTAVEKFLRAGDHVLLFGAGNGLIGSIAAKTAGAEKIMSVETDPDLLELSAETYRLNNVTNITLGASENTDEIDPTVLIVASSHNLQGLFDGRDLGKLRTVIITFKPGEDGSQSQKEILKHLDAQGFRAERDYLSGDTWVFNRLAQKAAPRIFTRGPTDPTHNLENPKFLITTCMKNEGPFILEWIAYHRSIGVQEFVIFSNDCTDGTDAMLNRLDELGIVTHLPNPATAAGSTYFQPLAMKFAMNMRQVRAADYVIESDVDEFIAIKAGSGHLTDLLRAAGPFHVLSISEVNFCSSGHWAFSDGWLTENFREHETPTPGHWQARRGVKSIIHGVDNFERWPVHRPGIFPGTQDQLVWLDGSGKPVPEDFIVKHENGIDRRGRYDLVQLDHHPLRSAQSFLLKQVRGDVVNAKNNVDMHYYRKRALGGHRHGVIDRSLPRAREEWNKLMQDPQLTEIHKASVAFHEDAALRAERNPALAELRDWIQQTYFPDLAT